MRRLSLTKPVSFLYSSGGTGDNSVRHVSREKVTTDGVKTSEIRTSSVCTNCPQYLQTVTFCVIILRQLRRVAAL